MRSEHVLTGSVWKKHTCDMQFCWYIKIIPSISQVGKSLVMSALHLEVSPIYYKAFLARYAGILLCACSVCVCVCVHACVRVFVCACVHVRVHVYMHSWMCGHVCVSRFKKCTLQFRVSTPQLNSKGTKLFWTLDINDYAYAYQWLFQHTVVRTLDAVKC